MTFTGHHRSDQRGAPPASATTPTANVNGADALIMTTDNGNRFRSSTIVAINVADAVNDAPTVAGDGTEEAAPIDEDTPSPTGQTVTDLFGGQIPTRPTRCPAALRPMPFAGVAVTANGSSPARPMAVSQRRYLGGYRPGFGRRGGAARRHDLDPLQPALRASAARRRH